MIVIVILVLISFANFIASILRRITINFYSYNLDLIQIHFPNCN